MAAAPRNIRAQQTRDRILSVALSEVARLGVDGLSVTSLIKIAGITRPTFYSYFGDIRGLLAEIWISRGSDWFEAIAFDAEFDADSVELRALTEIFISAHRSEELRTVVATVIDGRLNRIKDDNSAVTVALWRAANRIGILGTISVWPGVGEALFLDDFIRALRPASISVGETTVGELPAIALDDSDIVDSNIAQGIIGIVGSDGVGGLSLLRLGRLLRVTSGYLNPRIDDLNELVGLTYSLVQDSVARQNVQLWTLWNLSPRGFARFIVGSLGGSRMRWRMFRNEVLVASAHNPKLATLVAESMESLTTIVGGRVAGFGFAADVTRRMSVLVHTMLFGFSTLAVVGVDVQRLSHEGIIEALLKELARRKFRV